MVCHPYICNTKNYLKNRRKILWIVGVQKEGNGLLPITM